MKKYLRFINLERGGIFVYIDKILSCKVLGIFDFEETKKNVFNYFVTLEKLEWELAKLNAGRGLSVNYGFEAEYKKQPYIPFGKDMFNLSAKENKEEQLKKYIAGYYWAKSILSDSEQLYIKECFVNRKYEDEIVDLLGLVSSNCNEFKQRKQKELWLCLRKSRK